MKTSEAETKWVSANFRKGLKYKIFRAWRKLASGRDEGICNVCFKIKFNFGLNRLRRKQVKDYWMIGCHGSSHSLFTVV